jgi:NCAIR mutase (PurE)-related protein
MPYITSIEQLAKAEGKAESQTETALKLLQEHIDLAVITRVTGISLEALRQLQASPEN